MMVQHISDTLTLDTYIETKMSKTFIFHTASQNAIWLGFITPYI